jgi:hypothetical protein
LPIILWREINYLTGNPKIELSFNFDLFLIYFELFLKGERKANFLSLSNRAFPNAARSGAGTVAAFWCLGNMTM